jgi:hypothetical protein
MTSKNLSKSIVAVPEKPASKEAFNKQEAIDHLEIAMDRSFGISLQLAGLQNFCEHVDKGDEDVYRFASALEVLLGNIGGDAEYIGETVKAALEDLEKGRAA